MHHAKSNLCVMLRFGADYESDQQTPDRSDQLCSTSPISVFYSSITTTVLT